MIDSYVRMFSFHMLSHHMTTVSFRLLRKNLGNLRKVHCAPQQKIARTPMLLQVPGGGGYFLVKANGDILLCGVEYSRLD